MSNRTFRNRLDSLQCISTSLKRKKRMRKSDKLSHAVCPKTDERSADVPSHLRCDLLGGVVGPRRRELKSVPSHVQSSLVRDKLGTDGMPYVSYVGKHFGNIASTLNASKRRKRGKRVGDVVANDLNHSAEPSSKQKQISCLTDISVEKSSSSSSRLLKPGSNGSSLVESKLKRKSEAGSFSSVAMVKMKRHMKDSTSDKTSVPAMELCVKKKKGCDDGAPVVLKHKLYKKSLAVMSSPAQTVRLQKINDIEPLSAELSHLEVPSVSVPNKKKGVTASVGGPTIIESARNERKQTTYDVPLSINMSSTSVQSPQFHASQKKFQIPKRRMKPSIFQRITSNFKITTVSQVVVGKSVTTDRENPHGVSADDWEDIDDKLGDQCCISPEKCATNGEHDMERTLSPTVPEEIDAKGCEENASVSSEFHFVFGNVILQLKHPASFPFCGQLQVEVIKGAVEVLGYVLTPSRGSFSIFSPRGSCLLPIRTVVESDILLMQNGNISEVDLNTSEVVNMLRKGGENDAWLLLKKMDNILPVFLHRYVPFKLFPAPDVEQLFSSTFSKAAKKLQCLFQIPNKWKCFEEGVEWGALYERVQKSGCTVLCGGKHVGKSTMLRFLVNRLLHNGRSGVVVLDFDPGQAEFTIPGCVSLSIVTRPLLGPNFSHLQQPKRCVFIGDVNVSNCVTRYMDACVSLISYWRSEPAMTNLPCLVNTMGFNKGLGVTLMVQLLSVLRPNLVVQIQSTAASRNFPDSLSVDYVKRNCSSSPFTRCLELEMLRLEVKATGSGSIQHELFAVLSASEKSTDIVVGPRFSREIVIMSYLSQAASTPSYSLLDVVPFSCPFEKLYLYISHENVAPSLSLSAMNASLVALCYVEPSDDDVVQSSLPGMPAVITRPLSLECYGFGVVRGIDMDLKFVYISTPLLDSQMATVNCLMLGVVNLPASMLLNPPKESGPVPYVSVSPQLIAGRATH